MSVHQRFRHNVERMIEKHGQPATLIRSEKSGPGHNPTITETECPARFVQADSSFEYRQNTKVRAGEIVGYFSTNGEAPHQSDNVRIDGLTWFMIELEPIGVGETKLVHKFHARR